MAVHGTAMFAFGAVDDSCSELPPDETSIEISKSERILKIKNGDKVIKEYPCSFGKGGDDTKEKAGDNKTPVGEYYICDLKDDSQFYYFIHLSYPNIQDAERGLKKKIISKEEYRRIESAISYKKLPPQDTKLGGFIGIHGLNENRVWFGDLNGLIDWTQGCIAVTNEAIDDIKAYSEIGMKVIIKE